jgi:hypothetical protein
VTWDFASFAARHLGGRALRVPLSGRALRPKTRPIVEQPAQPIRGGTIDVVGDVRVEPDSEHGSGVPETTLHDPGMLTAGDHEGGGDVAETMNVEARPGA